MTQINDFVPTSANAPVFKVRIIRTTLYVAHVRGAERYGVKWAYGTPAADGRVQMHPQPDMLIDEEQTKSQLETPKLLVFNPLPTMIDGEKHPQVISIHIDAPEGDYVQALISAGKGDTWGHGKMFEFVSQPTVAQPPAPAFVINAGAKVIAEVESRPGVDADQVHAGGCPSPSGPCGDPHCVNPMDHLPAEADGVYALFPEAPVPGICRNVSGVIVEASYQDGTDGTRLCVAIDDSHEVTLVPGDESKYGGVTFYHKKRGQPAIRVELTIEKLAEILSVGSLDVTIQAAQ